MQEAIHMRLCTRCYEAHPVEFFNRDKSKPDGIYPYCKNCSRKACRTVYRKYHDKHVALKRAWKVGNADRHRQINRRWQLDNPEKVRENTAKYRAQLRLATPVWADEDIMQVIRDMRPEGYHVDHIHPLRGKHSCGLNVPWNLQYLPAEVHYRKQNRLPEDAEDVTKLVVLKSTGAA